MEENKSKYSFKLCVICHKYHFDEKLHIISVHRAFEEHFHLVRHFVEDSWPSKVSELPDYQTFDAIVWFVQFRDLVTKTPFDWGGYKGLRIMYEWDAHMNFSTITGLHDIFLGCWPEVYKKNKFQIMVVTGKKTRDNLLENGVNAYWIPKGYDSQRFFDKKEYRSGICHYGQLYPARRAMLNYLRNKGITCKKVKCSNAELNDVLNRFQICLVCNMDGKTKAGFMNKLANWFIPGSRLDIFPGPEVMIKNFEVAASGCVLFCDEIPELQNLGFIDGETMVSYRDFEELVEKLRYYLNGSEELSRISENAVNLCSRRHTWNHRIEMFANLLGQELYSRDI